MNAKQKKRYCDILACSNGPLKFYSDHNGHQIGSAATGINKKTTPPTEHHDYSLLFTPATVGNEAAFNCYTRFASSSDVYLEKNPITSGVPIGRFPNDVFTCGLHTHTPVELKCPFLL